MTDKFCEEKIFFLDLAFDRTPIDKALSAVRERQDGTAFSYIVTPNTDHMVRLHSSLRELIPLYEDAWLCLCDSRILYFLARLSGRRLTVVLGSDLTASVFREVIKTGETVCVIGGGDDVVELLQTHVGSYAVSHYNPPMGFVRDPAEIEKCVEFVINHPSRYIFFAVGSPQQEVVARAVLHTGKATGTGFCIGASIDFLTGKETRAPLWMQNAGLEWLYRLLHNPVGLWKRYLVRGPRIFIIYLSWLLSRSYDRP